MIARAGRIPVAILGPTGMVGQQFVRLLDDHPWFRLAELLGSDRSAGRSYDEATDWRVGGAPPCDAAGLRIGRVGDPIAPTIIFSALPSGAARTHEPRYRDAGHLVFTNAGPHRFGDGRVPIVPEVNGARLLRVVCSRDRGGGLIVPNPNCVVAGLAPVLAALDDAFDLEAVTVTTLQALSGAGLRGVSSLEALGNVIPDIPGEADKIAKETRAVLDRDLPVSVVVHRVPVHTGHMTSVRARTRGGPHPDDVARVLSSFGGRPGLPPLPSGHANPIRVNRTGSRPQPTLDVDADAGMRVTIGCLSADDLYDVKLQLLVHNTVRGAAGGSLLNAELAVSALQEQPSAPLSPHTREA